MQQPQKRSPHQRPGAAASGDAAWLPGARHSRLLQQHPLRRRAAPSCCRRRALRRALQYRRTPRRTPCGPAARASGPRAARPHRPARPGGSAAAAAAAAGRRRARCAAAAAGAPSGQQRAMSVNGGAFRHLGKHSWVLPPCSTSLAQTHRPLRELLLAAVNHLPAVNDSKAVHGDVQHRTKPLTMSGWPMCRRSPAKKSARPSSSAASPCANCAPSACAASRLSGGAPRLPSTGSPHASGRVPLCSETTVGTSPESQVLPLHAGQCVRDVSSNNRAPPLLPCPMACIAGRHRGRCMRCCKCSRLA